MFRRVLIVLAWFLASVLFLLLGAVIGALLVALSYLFESRH